VTVVLVLTILAQIVAAGLYKRYWIPLAAALQVPVIAYLVARIDRRIVRAGLLAVTVVLVAVQIRAGLRDEPGSLIAASVDSTEREQVLRERLRLSPLYDVANADADRGDAVLFTYGCGAFYFDGPSLCTDFPQDSLRLSDCDDFNTDLRDLGVAYVVAPTALATGGPRPSDGNGAGSVGFLTRDGTYAMVSRLLQERGELLATVDDQSVYRLAPAEATSSG
jgi:hypothetical protein